MTHLADFVTQVAGMTRDDADDASCLGIHLEGPWIHPQLAGAHEAAGIRPFRSDEAHDLVDRAEGPEGEELRSKIPPAVVVRSQPVTLAFSIRPTASLNRQSLSSARSSSLTCPSARSGRPSGHSVP